MADVNVRLYKNLIRELYTNKYNYSSIQICQFIQGPSTGTGPGSNKLIYVVLMINYVTYDEYIYLYTSSDGMNWEKDYFIDNDGIGTLQLTCDVEGNIYIVYNISASPKNRFKLKIKDSSGWRETETVTFPGASGVVNLLTYPAICIDKNGYIHVIFAIRRTPNLAEGIGYAVKIGDTWIQEDVFWAAYLPYRSYAHFFITVDDNGYVYTAYTYLYKIGSASQSWVGFAWRDDSQTPKWDLWYWPHVALHQWHMARGLLLDAKGCKVIYECWNEKKWFSRIFNISTPNPPYRNGVFEDEIELFDTSEFGGTPGTWSYAQNLTLVDSNSDMICICELDDGDYMYEAYKKQIDGIWQPLAIWEKWTWDDVWITYLETDVFYREVPYIARRGTEFGFINIYVDDPHYNHLRIYYITNEPPIYSLYFCYYQKGAINKKLIASYVGNKYSPAENRYNTDNSLIRYGSKVYYAILEYALDEPAGIVMYKSSDRGMSWAREIVSSDEYTPYIAIDSSGNIHLVYAKGSNDGKLYYKRMIDGEWEATQEISTNWTGCNNPSISIDNSGTVHIIYAFRDTVTLKNGIAHAWLPLESSWNFEIIEQKDIDDDFIYDDIRHVCDNENNIHVAYAENEWSVINIRYAKKMASWSVIGYVEESYDRQFIIKILLDNSDVVIYWSTAEDTQYSRKYSNESWEDIETIETISDDFYRYGLAKEDNGTIDIVSVIQNAGLKWACKQKIDSSWQESKELETTYNHRKGPAMLNIIKS